VITWVDRALSNFSGETKKLKQLGDRHKGYGVVEAHFDVVGQALIKTLGMALGDKFTDELKGYWVIVFGMVKSAMNPKIRVEYFDMHGRAHHIRLLLDYFGVDYEDRRIDRPSFFANKTAGNYTFG